MIEALRQLFAKAMHFIVDMGAIIQAFKFLFCLCVCGI